MVEKQVVKAAGGERRFALWLHRTTKHLLVTSCTLLIGATCVAENTVTKKAETPAHESSGTTTRLASFAPSCTELIEAIGAQKCLVGVCKYCDLPADSKIERIGDFNSANMERLTRLKPDTVMAVSGQDSLTNSLKRNKFSVLTFQNSRLADISDNLVVLGKLTNRQDEASLQSKAFISSIEHLREICHSQKTKPSVFFCVWPQPLMTAGKSSFLNEAISACGGKNVAEDLAAPYPHFSLERLVLANPDVVIMPYEAKAEDYIKRAPWNTLKASTNHRIYFLPKFESDRLLRPSTKVVDGLYWLAIQLHPENSKDLSDWLNKARHDLKLL